MIVSFQVTGVPDGLTVRNSLGGSIVPQSVKDILDFLIYSCPSASPTAPRVFADLDYAVSFIVSLLPDSAQSDLHKGSRVVWGGYRIFYIPTKLLGLSKNHDTEAVFYDLAQYYPEEDLVALPIQQVQQKADLLLQTLSDLGISSPTKLTSPVAVAEASDLLGEYRTTIPTLFDAPEPYWEAYEFALQCTPREWVSAYQIGNWDDLEGEE